MKWSLFTKKDNATIIPPSWIHIHYYEALNTLFRIENSLRVFVYVVLKNQLLDKWNDISITSDDSDTGTIRSIANKRINQAQDFGYLGYAINCPVMYLTSGELIRIIIHDSYWKYFKPYFPASKQIIEHKLDEIGTIRNSLAHFRPLKSEDVEVIKQNANHALTGVEDCLNQLGNCYTVVPTNTQDQWYLALSILGTDPCHLQLKQCENEQWVTLTLTYKAQVLETNHWAKGYYQYNILNLISPAILTKYSNLAKYLTCLKESEASTEGWKTGYDPKTPDFRKTIEMLFSRKVLIDNFSTIKADIESLLKTITEETDLMIKDNLAKGTLVSIVRVSSILKTDATWWESTTDKSLNPITKVDLPEYWGNTILNFSLLTSAQKYPWMPAKVSEFDI